MPKMPDSWKQLQPGMRVTNTDNQEGTVLSKDRQFIVVQFDHEPEYYALVQPLNCLRPISNKEA